MGKSVRAHTVRFHKRIKREKMQKLVTRRAETIAARAAANLAKYNAELAAKDDSMPSLTPADIATAKMIIEEEAPASSNAMDLVENIDEIPTATATSMKKKRKAARK